jgi:hypothetical protein
MVNFTESFNTGIKSAQKADENRIEIRSVFDELNNQLNEPTDGRIKISRVKFYESTNPFKVSFLVPKKFYWAIAAENPKAEQESTKELAKWDMNRAGYPCKITLGNDDLYCEDKESLEYGLSQILQDSVVGETLSKLMKLPDEAPENNDGETEGA